MWQGVHAAWAQSTPQGLLPVFIALWHTKQAGVPFLDWFTRWSPELTPKHSELCCVSGTGYDRVSRTISR